MDGRAWAWLILLLTATSTAAQFPGREEELSNFGRRYDALQLLFADREISLGEFVDMRAADDPSRWILLVLGENPRLASQGFDVPQFVQKGGSVLVASDRSMGVTVGPGAHFRILPGPIRAMNPADQYDGHRFCPLVTQLNKSFPLFQGVERLASNLPGVLAAGDSSAWTVAYLPRSIDRPSLSRSLIVAGGMEQGRFVVLADQSILSNEMIREADNARFAENLVSYLIADKDPARSRLVMIADRREPSELVDERFLSGDWSQIPSTSELLNELLTGLQEEDALNGIAREAQATLSSRGPWPVRQMAVILLAAVSLSLIVWRVLHARRDEIAPAKRPNWADTWQMPLSAAEQAAQVPSQRILEERQKAEEGSGNFARALRQSIRAFVARHGGEEAWKEGFRHLSVSGSWWRRRWADKQLRSLRQLHQRPMIGPISLTTWQSWQRRLAQLDTMILPSEQQST